MTGRESLFPYGHHFGDQVVTKRVIVCGSRDWHDRELIADVLNTLVLERGWRFPDPVIVHGAARGADRLAGEEAGKAGLVVEPHRADWEQFGKAAGPIRNREMASHGADLCIGFGPTPGSGTQDMLNVAASRNIPTLVVHPRLA